MKLPFLSLSVPAMALAAALVAPAAAQPTSPAPAFPRTLSMTGEGEARAAPDMAQVSAGVTTSAPTAAAALAANTARMKAVFAAIQKLGVPEKNIQTVNFSVSPQYTGGDANSRPRLTGYQVNNEVSVRLDDIAKLGGALDALVTAGSNQMNGISFSIKNPAPLLVDARGRAVADAKTRAEAYAKAAGVTLGPILSISENNASAPPPMPKMRMMTMAAESVPVAEGEQSVVASVSIVWEIR